MARLQLERVGKRYGDHVVLADVTMRLDAGDTVLLRGASGSGKTTLLHLIGLLEAPSDGRILLDDEDVAKASPDERAHHRLLRIGHVFQTHNMMPRLTLLENVLLPMRLARRVDEARARSLLDSMGLHDKTDAHPNEVSIGQRQRAALARALANEPDILLADEPTASLDDENADVVASTLRRLADKGALVIIASHDARLREALPRRREFDMEPPPS